eukprot:ctg_485.g180
MLASLSLLARHGQAFTVRRNRVSQECDQSAAVGVVFNALHRASRGTVEKQNQRRCLRVLPESTKSHQRNAPHGGGAQLASSARGTHDYFRASRCTVRPASSVAEIAALRPLFPRSVHRAALGLLRVAQLKVLASLDDVLHNPFALVTLHFEHDLLGGLGLFLEHRLGLPAVPALFPIVSPLALRRQRVLALLVLRHLVHGVLLALARAECAPRLGADDHSGGMRRGRGRTVGEATRRRRERAADAAGRPRKGRRAKIGQNDTYKSDADYRSSVHLTPVEQACDTPHNLTAPLDISGTATLSSILSPAVPASFRTRSSRLRVRTRQSFPHPLATPFSPSPRVRSTAILFHPGNALRTGLYGQAPGRSLRVVSKSTRQAQQRAAALTRRFWDALFAVLPVVGRRGHQQAAGKATATEMKEYLELFARGSESAEDVALRKQRYVELSNGMYDIATDFYEWVSRGDAALRVHAGAASPAAARRRGGRPGLRSGRPDAQHRPLRSLSRGGREHLRLSGTARLAVHRGRGLDGPVLDHQSGLYGPAVCRPLQRRRVRNRGHLPQPRQAQDVRRGVSRPQTGRALCWLRMGVHPALRPRQRRAPAHPVRHRDRQRSAGHHDHRRDRANAARGRLCGGRRVRCHAVEREAVVLAADQRGLVPAQWLSAFTTRALRHPRAGQCVGDGAHRAQRQCHHEQDAHGRREGPGGRRQAGYLYALLFLRGSQTGSVESCMRSGAARLDAVKRLCRMSVGRQRGVRGTECRTLLDSWRCPLQPVCCGMPWCIVSWSRSSIRHAVIRRRLGGSISSPPQCRCLSYPRPSVPKVRRTLPFGVMPFQNVSQRRQQQTRRRAPS